MATQTISSPNLSLRAKLILTGVIPALVPWAPLILSSHLPDILVRFLLLSKGWVAWTLIEYSMHRWSMHGNAKNKSRQKDSFNHHHHHTHPDNMIFNHLHRSISLVTLFLCVFTLFAGPVWLCYPAGLVFGFTLYMLVHWFLHQRMSIQAFPMLVKHHIWHHCKYPNKCFGVTSMFWDRLFKSLPLEYKSMPNSIIEFYFKHEGLTDLEIARVAKLMNKVNNQRQASSSLGLRA
jgi:sterol desaturase/sphingolipid hydroxylase (fatty acid hydroxylase superfamily)